VQLFLTHAFGARAASLPNSAPAEVDAASPRRSTFNVVEDVFEGAHRPSNTQWLLIEFQNQAS